MNLTSEDIMQFLPKGKFTIANVDSYRSNELEATQEAYVLSRLSPHYDISTWDTDPPTLVKSVVSMMVAAQMYMSNWADSDTDLPAYGENLMTQAKNILDGMVNGSINIDDTERETAGFVKDIGDPIFEIGERF